MSAQMNELEDFSSFLADTEEQSGTSYCFFGLTGDHTFWYDNM